MNFIIAVIGDSYNAVIEFKEAHDYQQRIMMIYEREASFSDKDFDNQIYFPNVLIVRKKKENKESKNNFQNVINNVKALFKTHLGPITDTIASKTKE